MNLRDEPKLPTEELSPDAPLRPEAMGRRFEAAWGEGQKLRIEDFLPAAPENARRAVFEELLKREINLRKAEGENPTRDEYVSRFAEFRRIVESAFGKSPLAEKEPSTVAWQPIEPSARTGRYEMKTFHARGGMGEVWRAFDGEIGRQVALKRMIKERGREYVDRFLAEAQITGQLELPSIVPVHDLGLDETNQPYYIMKFVEGRTLRDMIEEHHSEDRRSASGRELERLRLLEIFLQICRAVAYAHHRGVIHRDIKPSNVMLGPYGETVVMDWGLTKILHQEDQPPDAQYEPLSGVRGSSKTVAGAAVGTPNYMSPEAAEGKSGELDQLADVYLLGATLFEILTGQPPRKGTSRDEVLELARSSPPVSPRKLNKNAPKPLASICLKAMSRRKQSRYASAEALAEDLQRYLAGEKVSAHREGIATRAWRLAKRRRRELGWTAAATLMVLLGAVAFVSFREARVVRLREAAREDLQQVRELADEVIYVAANTDPIDPRAPIYDLDRGMKKAKDAFAVVERWGPDFEDWPFSDEKQAPPRQEVYELHVLLAQALMNQGDKPEITAEALSHLERAQQFASPSRRFYQLQAHFFDQRKEPAKAEEARRKLEDPQTPVGALDHFLVGEEFRLQSASDLDVQIDAKKVAHQPRILALQNAVNSFRLALQESPDHFWARLQLGRCYFALGQRKEAVEALGACIALRPDSPWGYTARSVQLALADRVEDALADLNHDAVKGFPPAVLNQGVVHWINEDNAEALKYFDQVLQGPEENRMYEAHLYRGLIFMQQKQWNNAAADLDRAIAELPRLRQAYLFRAEVHFEQQRNQQALDDLSWYLGWAPGSEKAKTGQAHFERGRLIRKLFDRERAPLGSTSSRRHTFS